MADIIQSKEVLKAYFETGDKPTEIQYRNLIHSLRHKNDKIALQDLGLEGYDEEGERDNNLIVRLGDFVDANNGTKIVITDDTNEVGITGNLFVEGDLNAYGQTITAGNFIGDGSQLTNLPFQTPENVAFKDQNNNFTANQTFKGDIIIGENTNQRINFDTSTIWNYYLQSDGNNWHIDDSEGTKFIELLYNSGGNTKSIEFSTLANFNGNLTANNGFLVTDGSTNKLETEDLGLIVKGNSATRITLDSVSGNDAVISLDENGVQKAKLGFDSSDNLFKIISGTGPFSDNTFTLDSSGNSTQSGGGTFGGTLSVSSSNNLLANFSSTDSIGEIRVADNTAYTRLLTVGSDFKIMPNDGAEVAVFEGDTLNTSLKGDLNVDGLGKFKNVQIGINDLSDANNKLKIYATNDGTYTAANNDVGSEIIMRNLSTQDGNFSALSGYDANNLVSSRIAFVNDDVSNRNGSISFLTHNGIILGEKMNIGTSTVDVSLDLDVTGYDVSADYGKFNHLQVGINDQSNTRNTIYLYSTNDGVNPVAYADAGGEIVLNNLSTQNGNFSAVSGFNANGLVSSKIAFINKDVNNRHGNISFLTHDGSTFAERLGIGTSSVDVIADLNVTSTANFTGAVKVEDTLKLGSSAGNNALNSGTLDFLENINNNFGEAFGHGFRLTYNGDGNLFDFKGGNGTSTNTIFSVSRDDGEFNFYRDLKLNEGSQNVTSHWYKRSIYHADNGILIETDVDTVDNKMIELIIEGNSYANRNISGPIISRVQAYNYATAGTIVNSGALTNDPNFTIDVFHYNGKVYFWFEQTNTFQTYSFKTNAGVGSSPVKIVNVTNAVKPTTGVTNNVSITPIQILTSASISFEDIPDRPIWNWGTERSDITGLTGGSVFGTIYEGTATGHIAVGIQGNDSGDSFWIFETEDGMGGLETYTKAILRVNDTYFQYNGNDVIHTGNFQSIVDDNFVTLDTTQTISGTKTFSNNIAAPSVNGLLINDGSRVSSSDGSAITFGSGGGLGINTTVNSTGSINYPGEFGGSWTFSNNVGDNGSTWNRTFTLFTAGDNNVYLQTYAGGTAAGWSKILTENNFTSVVDDNFVTLDTTQTITGEKTFTQDVNMQIAKPVYTFLNGYSSGSPVIGVKGKSPSQSFFIAEQSDSTMRMMDMVETANGAYQRWYNNGVETIRIDGELGDIETQDLKATGAITLESINPGIIFKETDLTDLNIDLQVNGGQFKIYGVNDARDSFNEWITVNASNGLLSAKAGIEATSNGNTSADDIVNLFSQDQTRRFRFRADGVLNWGSNLDSGSGHNGSLSWDTGFVSIASHNSKDLKLISGSGTIVADDDIDATGKNVTAREFEFDLNGGTITTSLLRNPASGGMVMDTNSSVGSSTDLLAIRSGATDRFLVKGNGEGWFAGDVTASNFVGSWQSKDVSDFVSIDGTQAITGVKTFNGLVGFEGGLIANSDVTLNQDLHSNKLIKIYSNGTDGDALMLFALDNSTDWVYSQKGSGLTTGLELKSFDHKNYYHYAAASYFGDSVDESNHFILDHSAKTADLTGQLTVSGNVTATDFLGNWNGKTIADFVSTNSANVFTEDNTFDKSVTIGGLIDTSVFPAPPNAVPAFLISHNTTSQEVEISAAQGVITFQDEVRTTKTAAQLDTADAKAFVSKEWVEGKESGYTGTYTQDGFQYTYTNGRLTSRAFVG